MKTSIKLCAAIMAVAMCCGLSSCKKDALNDNQPFDDAEFYTVSLGMDGEILEVTDEPLLRGSGEKDLYGIQVYSTPNKDLPEGQKTVWSNYAYGLFTTGKDLTINLMKGYRYKFVATMVVDGQEKLFSGSQKTSYLSPFTLSGMGSSWMKIGTQFDYQSAYYLSGLGRGYATSIDGNHYNHPNLERFYGELVDYIPGQHGNKAMIKMKRVAFGAKFHAKGKLATVGTLEAQITEAPKMLLDLTVSDKTMSDIFTFSNVAAAWADNNFTETIPVTLNMHKPDGSIFPLGTHQITFKRNKMTVVNVTIENESLAGQLGIEIDDVDMTEDDDQTNITDGEVVDTEVDTNA